MSLVALLLALCFPAFALWLVARHAWAARLGTIVLCYAAGLLVGNAGLLPAGTLAIRAQLAEAAIALALPMILFTIDVRSWARTAPRALWSMALAVTSVVAVATALFYVASRHTQLPRAQELAGLAVGVYTGGTPNLAAIKIALGVDDARYLLFNAVDTLVSAVYLMFMVTLGKTVFGRILAPAAGVAGEGAARVAGDGAYDEDYRPLLGRGGLRNSVASLSVAVAVVGLALAAVAILADGESPALLITLVATFGIAASLVPQVRRLRESYKAGMYLIYVFSFTVASMAGLDALAGADAVLPAFIAAAVFGSLALHAFLCRLARIDVDTFLVTSVSAICSPAFVPLVARSLGNPAMLLSGITTGIIGYAVGTYLGIGLALLLAHLG